MHAHLFVCVFVYWGADYERQVEHSPAVVATGGLAALSMAYKEGGDGPQAMEGDVMDKTPNKASNADGDMMVLTLNKVEASGGAMSMTLNKTGTADVGGPNGSGAMVMTTGVSNSDAMVMTLNKTRGEGVNDSDAMVMTGADGVAGVNDSDAMVMTLNRMAGNVSLGLCEGGDGMDGDAMIMTRGNMSFSVREEDGMNGDVMKTAGNTSFDDGDGMILTLNKTMVNTSFSMHEDEDGMALTLNKTTLPELSGGTEDMDIDITLLECGEMAAPAPAYSEEQAAAAETDGLDNTYTVANVVATDPPTVSTMLDYSAPPPTTIASSALAPTTVASIPSAASLPSAAIIVPMTASFLKLSTFASSAPPATTNVTPAITTTAPSPKVAKSPASARKPGRPRSTTTAPSPKLTKSPASAAKKPGMPPLNWSTSTVLPPKSPASAAVKMVGSGNPQQAKPPLPGVPAEETAKQVTESRSRDVSSLQNTSRKRGRPPKAVHVPQNILSKRAAVSTPLSRHTGSAARCTPIMSAGLNSSRVTRSMIQSASKEREVTVISPSNKSPSRTTQPCDMELTTLAAAPKARSPSRMNQPCDMELTTVDTARSPSRINQSCDMQLTTMDAAFKVRSPSCNNQSCDMDAAFKARNPSRGNQSCDMELTTVGGAPKACSPSRRGNRTATVIMPKAVSVNQSSEVGPKAVSINQSTMSSEVGPHGRSRIEVTTSTLNSNSTSDRLTSVTTISFATMTSVTPGTPDAPDPGGSMVVPDAAGRPNQTLVNGMMVVRDEGNWLQNHDNDFVLLESSSDASSSLGLVETTSSSTLTETTTETTPSTPSPTTGARRKRKPLSKGKKQYPLRPSLLRRLKEKTQAPVQVVEIETPETVTIDYRTAAVQPTQDSIFPSPDLTIVEERFKNRQSLMMSPSAFKKFEDKLDADKGLMADICIDGDVPGACVEVSANGEELSGALERTSISQSAAVMEDGGSDVDMELETAQLERQFHADEPIPQPPSLPLDASPQPHNSTSTHPSTSQPHPSPFQLAHDVSSQPPQQPSPSTSTSQSAQPRLSACRFQLAQALMSQLHPSSSGAEPQPHPSPSRSQPADVAHAQEQPQPCPSPNKSQLQLHPSPNKSQLQPHPSPNKSQLQPHPSPCKPQPASAAVTSQPHPSPKRPQPPLSISSQSSASPSRSERVSSSPSESVLSPAFLEVPPSPSISVQTHVASSSDFIMHVHTLRTK